MIFELFTAIFVKPVILNHCEESGDSRGTQSPYMLEISATGCVELSLWGPKHPVVPLHPSLCAHLMMHIFTITRTSFLIY